MYKNWDAICAISNPHVRILAATAKDQRLIKILTRKRPGIFLTQKPERDGPRPLSAIRCVVGERMTSATDLVHAHIVIREVFELSCQLGTYHDDAVEKNVLHLTKEEAAAIWDVPRLATQFADLFPIGLVTVVVGGTSYYVGYVGEIYVQLYPCALINERA